MEVLWLYRLPVNEGESELKGCLQPLQRHKDINYGRNVDINSKYRCKGHPHSCEFPQANGEGQSTFQGPCHSRSRNDAAR